VVTLYLPRARGEAAEETAAEASPAVADGRVLLVEDNPEVAEATGSLLEQLGYQVEHAADAGAALAAIGVRPPFDLMVSDIMMPGEMNGLGLARTVRQQHPALPVVLVTGYHQLAEQAGREFTLMRKPFDLSDLSRATSRAMTAARHDGQSNVVTLPTRPKPSQ
jgi:CheY-like chemotaxis protein